MTCPREVQDMRDEIDRLKREIQDLSIDGVTGIPGRKVLDRELNQQFSRARRFERQVGLMMIDIDFFKRFNDEHGHAAGDKVLHEVAQVIAAQVRECDTVGRYGGEEFVICIDEPRMIGMFAERLRNLVEAIDVPDLPGVTISIGCATTLHSNESLITALKRADQALYRAKDAGRNNVQL